MVQGFTIHSSSCPSKVSWFPSSLLTYSYKLTYLCGTSDRGIIAFERAESLEEFCWWDRCLTTAECLRSSTKKIVRRNSYLFLLAVCHQSLITGCNRSSTHVNFELHESARHQHFFCRDHDHTTPPNQAILRTHKALLQYDSSWWANSERVS